MYLRPQNTAPDMDRWHPDLIGNNYLPGPPHKKSPAIDHRDDSLELP